MKFLILITITIILNKNLLAQDKLNDSIKFINQAKRICLLPIYLEDDSIIMAKMIVNYSYLTIKESQKNRRKIILIRIRDTFSAKFKQEYLLCYDNEKFHKSFKIHEFNKIMGFTDNNKKLQKIIIKKLLKSPFVLYDLDYWLTKSEFNKFKKKSWIKEYRKKPNDI